MIREVLQLGIKGQDLVETTLKKIQKEKEKFARKATVDLAVQKDKEVSSIKAAKDRDLKFSRQSHDQQMSFLKAEREAETEKELRKTSRGAEHAMKAARGVSTLEGGAAITSTLKGVASAVGGPVGLIAAEAASMFIEAGQTFKENVKAATNTFADTMTAQSRVANLTGGQPFLRSIRTDISVDSQRAIAESLGQKYGTIQGHLMESMKRIFVSDRGPTDIAQATAIAGGQFSALGTDKGFFMQKIADQFSGLPPSIRQEMTAKMLDMIPSKELYATTTEAYKARSAQVAFDDEARRKAALYMGPKDEKGQYAQVQTALHIQHLENTLDTSLNRGMGILANKLDVLIRSFSERTGGAKARP